MLEYILPIVVLVGFLLMAYLNTGRKQILTVPGPNRTSKQDGNLADIARAGSFHEYLVNLHKQYGDIASFWFGRELVVSICSPELFKQHSAVFDRPANLFKLFEPLLGKKSIEYAIKEDGKHRRKLYNTVFNPNYLHHYYETIQEKSNDLIEKLSRLPQDEHVPLTRHMGPYAVNLGIASLFGKNALTEEEMGDFRHNFNAAWFELERQLTDIPEKDSPRIKTFSDAREKLHELVDKMITNRKTLRRDVDDTLFIDVLMESSDDQELIICDALTFAAGSFHTTEYLLTWAVYFLAKHQDVQDKVYREIQQVLGDNDVEPGSMKDLVYLRQVLDETLRCSVLSIYTGRYLEVESELGGHKIPPNMPVIHALGVSHQNEKYFPEPNKFDPNRFSPENTKSRPAFSFQPFGFAGKRMCPGYKFVYVEGTIGLVTILKKFKVKLVEGQTVTQTFGLVTRPKEEIWVTLHKR